MQCLLLFTFVYSLDVVIETMLFRDNLTSFAAFPSIGSDTRSTTITMSIKPLEKDGFIFYAGRKTTPPFIDYISVGLYDGYVEFRYDLGSGTVEIKSTERLVLYQWHTIRAERNMRNGRYCCR